MNIELDITNLFLEQLLKDEITLQEYLEKTETEIDKILNAPE